MNGRRLMALAAVAAVAAIAVPAMAATNAAYADPEGDGNTTGSIPTWVKTVFAYYIDGYITDAELVSALQYLMDQGVLQVPDAGAGRDAGADEPPGAAGPSDRTPATTTTSTADRALAIERTGRVIDSHIDSIERSVKDVDAAYDAIRAVDAAVDAAFTAIDEANAASWSAHNSRVPTSYFTAATDRADNAAMGDRYSASMDAVGGMRDRIGDVKDALGDAEHDLAHVVDRLNAVDMPLVEASDFAAMSHVSTLMTGSFGEASGVFEDAADVFEGMALDWVLHADAAGRAAGAAGAVAAITADGDEEGAAYYMSSEAQYAASSAATRAAEAAATASYLAGEAAVALSTVAAHSEAVAVMSEVAAAAHADPT